MFWFALNMGPQVHINHRGQVSEQKDGTYHEVHLIRDSFKSGSRRIPEGAYVLEHRLQVSIASNHHELTKCYHLKHAHQLQQHAIYPLCVGRCGRVGYSKYWEP